MKEKKIKVQDEPGFGVTPRIIRDRYHVYDTVGTAPNNKQGLPNIFFLSLKIVFQLLHNSWVNFMTNWIWKNSSHSSIGIKYLQ